MVLKQGWSDRGTELGEVLCPATDRTALFLENPVRGAILRTAIIEPRTFGILLRSSF